MIIDKGTQIAVTSGQYSDYHTLGVFEALKDFDVESECAAYLFLKPEQKAPYRFNDASFLNFLCQRECLRQIKCPYTELHLPDYGCIIDHKGNYDFEYYPTYIHGIDD